MERRQHYNVRSRNCDDTESVKDVDFSKVESQVIQVYTIVEIVFHPIEYSLLTKEI